MSEPDLTTPEGLLQGRIKHRMEVLVRFLERPTERRSVRDASTMLDSIVADIYEHAALIYQRQWRTMLGLEPKEATAASAPPERLFPSGANFGAPLHSVTDPEEVGRRLLDAYARTQGRSDIPADLVALLGDASHALLNEGGPK